MKTELEDAIESFARELDIIAAALRQAELRGELKGLESLESLFEPDTAIGLHVSARIAELKKELTDGE